MTHPVAGSDVTVDKGLSAIPEGFEGIMIFVPSAHPDIDGVIVERWSIEKGNVIRKHLFEIYRSLPDETKEALWNLDKDDAEDEDKAALDLAELLFSVIDRVENEIDIILRLSIREKDREHFGNMFYDEKLDLLTAVIQTNPTILPKLKKKVPEWIAQFGQMWKGSQ